jgi:hypothetical protein
MRNRYVAAAVIRAVALWLLMDATTFALYAEDPTSGRAKGCYTTLEYALGVKAPSAIRQAEASSGLVGLLVAPIIVFRGRGKRRRI